MKINKNFKTKKMKIILKREGNPSGAEERSYRNLFGKDGESRVTKGRINSVNQIAWLFGRTEDTIIAGLLNQGMSPMVVFEDYPQINDLLEFEGYSIKTRIDQLFPI